MSGRIRAEDVAAVRDAVRIDDVIGEHVTLKPAGGGSLKGLCPFHDERSPSFHVTPSKGLYHCFGCQAGGDAITFLMQLQGLTFAEAVERLAARAGITLRYEDGGLGGQPSGQRARLVAANNTAQRFFASMLLDEPGEAAREVLQRRGFTIEDCQRFGVGYAPAGWDGLARRLRAEGFDEATALEAGLVVQGRRGPYDRFRDRITWPIRDLSGDILGFGARRMGEEGPKYLNTPETRLYRKSQVLYGLDLARRTIAQTQQVVVVEGYTDVMAAHLAGVTNAVATCGTAFGPEHIAVLRRLLLDAEGSSGQVVFTFDSDEAGRRAALRAFGSDQQFAADTYVAVEPSGLDPADLRLERGDQALRDLVARRVPLFEFALRAAVEGVDIATAEGRVAGLRRSAPIIAAIKDRALRPEYERTVAGWLALPERTVAEAVAAVSRQRGESGRRNSGSARPAGRELPQGLERDALRGLVQLPHEAGPWLASVEPGAFDVPEYRALYSCAVDVGPPEEAEPEAAWLERLLRSAPEELRPLVRALAVEPLPVLADSPEEAGRYVVSLLASLLDRDAARRLDALAARLRQPQAAADTVRRALQEQYLAVAELRRDLLPFIRSEVG